MKLYIVLIHELEEIGHVYPDKPNVVHYVADGVKHESTIKPANYTIIEEIEIAQEEI